ncbi:MAG: GAF domain-containing protein, partial [Thermoplasmata archaeon]
MTGRVSHRDALDRIRAILRSESGVEESLREAVEALHETEMYYNWVGIYLLEGEDLILAAWKGPQATEHTRIPIGKGVCGLAARTREVVNVTDVTKDPRYMMCFP